MILENSGGSLKGLGFCTCVENLEETSGFNLAQSQLVG